VTAGLGGRSLDDAELSSDEVRALCEHFDLAPVRLSEFTEEAAAQWRIAPMAGETRFDATLVDQAVGESELEVMRDAVRRIVSSSAVLEMA
jgi:hypothetical protein